MKMAGFRGGWLAIALMASGGQAGAQDGGAVPARATTSPPVNPVYLVAAPAAPADPVVLAPGAQPETATQLSGPPKPPRDPNKGAVTNLPLPRYVTLKTGEGNARRGPGLTHRIDWVFTTAGMPLKITAEHEHWRRVEDAEGAGGWVHYSLLSGVRAVLVAQDMAEFRSRPEDASSVMFQAEIGVIARLLECQAAWCRVAVDGNRAWARKSDLWGVSAEETFQ